MVIFLDIDGVLNSICFCKDLGEEWTGDQLDPKNIKYLNKIVNATNSDIVISSSWKIFFKFDVLKKKLQDYGVIGNIIGTTEILHQDRCEEIQDWLDNHPTDRFVILDDNCLTLDETKFCDPYLMEHFVKTSTCIGLQESDADKAIEILIRKE